MQTEGLLIDTEITALPGLDGPVSGGERADTAQHAPAQDDSGLEAALSEQAHAVDEAIAHATRYVNALKAWKKACDTGHLAARTKASQAAAEQAPGLPGLTQRAVAVWSFDARAYLESAAWRDELRLACDAIGLRAEEDEESLVVPPVVVTSDPARLRLMLGRTGWQAVRPQTAAAHLKQLHERASSEKASQQFVNWLYEAVRYLNRSTPGEKYARFRDIYDMFARAPGWRRENPEAKFAQQIYQLSRSSVRTARDGKAFGYEFPPSKSRKQDIFTVVSDDGQAIDYYGIWFK